MDRSYLAAETYLVYEKGEDACASPRVSPIAKFQAVPYSYCGRENVMYQNVMYPAFIHLDTFESYIALDKPFFEERRMMECQTQDSKLTSACYAIGFLNKKTNHVSYYTGKTDGDWLSPNPKDALFGYSLSGVHWFGRRIQERHPSVSKLELVPVTHP